MEKVRLIKIGSAFDNDVVINDESISPYHLELFQDQLGIVFVAGKFMFDWVKLTKIQDVSHKIEDSTTNWLYSENKMNAVHLPIKEELQYVSDNEGYDLEDDATWSEKWKYFYTHNASIVHIFALNIVLFILFYLAFLS